MSADLSDTALTPPIIEATRSEPKTRRALPRRYDAVLFSSFGGPEKPDDVLPFLRNVTRGRGIPDERLEEVGQHYQALGGRSPINEQNVAMIEALRGELSSRGIDLPVYWGNRNWEPYMRQTVEQIHADGHRQVLAIATSAYSSYSSCRQYREDFGKALVESGLLGTVEIDKSRPYFNHPGFLAPTVDGLAGAIDDLRQAGHAADSIRVLFSTHSIPTAMAEASGPLEAREAGTGGWYEQQHLAACRFVMDAIAGRGDGAQGDADQASVPDWELVYQSRSGAPHIPWLEPDVNDVIEGLAEAGGTSAVIVVPIGFVSDHVEVIWDLDTEAKETAQEHSLDFRRVATAGTDPRFIAALADLVAERLDPDVPRHAVTDFGPTADVCGTACCLSGSSRAKAVPTTSAIDSADDLARARAAQADEG